MPCPPDTPINGHSKISTYAQGRKAAEAQAVAAVQGAATAEAFANTNCPADCRFPSPYNIRYKITKVDSSFSFLNIVTLGLFAVFGGAIYEGVAEFDWWATARCVDRVQSVLFTVGKEDVSGH
jgi:hypothetical protein